MSRLLWGLFLTTSRNTIKEFNNTRIILGIIESITIPYMEVLFVSGSEAAVRREMALQKTFYGVDALEFFKYYDTGFEYIRMLRAAFAEMVQTLKRNHVRIEGKYRRKLARASRGFRENAKARVGGRYKGLAGGRKSPLSTVMSVHDASLIDINDTENADDFSWEQYINKEYLEARDDVGG